MRGFILVICLFLILAVGIMVNYHYVHSFFLEINDFTDMLNAENPTENENIIAQLKEIWEIKGKWLWISVGLRERNEISNNIDRLYIANKYGTKSEIEKMIKMLKNSLEEIIRLEKFSISNIF